MMLFRKIALLGFFALFFSANLVNGAYLNRPELVDFNYANADICEKVSLRIKFDYENFDPGNVFTVEISSPSGSFSVSTTLIGSLTASGSQQNVFLTVAFPASVLGGNSYRLRVKGSSPLTYSSQLNEYPFTISKLIPSDPNFFPTGYWRGYMYTWNPSTTGIIADANNEDVFNPNNYVGYLTEDTLSFEYNWGNTANAPGTLPDTVKVCGSYRDNFSLRMRRRINFEAGYYIFGGGADDGFRLSIDGGTTWLINDWSDHAYRGSLFNNGCGIQLTAGVRDVIVEFYDHLIDARFRCVIKKTGDPAVNPIGIVSPVDGATICSNSPPIALVGNPPGAYQWSGTGVSAAGWLNPAIGPLGFRTITYQTGLSAFGQNCVKTASITVNIVAGLSAAFTGLDSVYCVSQTNPITLVPQNPGGVFAGNGIVGSNTFIPSQAGPGFHFISYALNTPGGCNDTVQVKVHVYSPISITIAPISPSFCSSDLPIQLSAVPSGGVFSGPGVSGSTFNPSLAPAGNVSISYQLIQGSCTSNSSITTQIFQKPTATLSLPLASFCEGSDQAVKISFSPAGGALTGTGVVNDSLKIKELDPGNYSLQYIATNGGCADTAYFPFVVYALPNAGFTDLPDTVCVGSPNISLIPQQVGGQFVGQGVIPPNQFSPGILLPDNTYRIEYQISINGCSNRSEQFVNILSKLKPTLQFPTLKNRYCSSDPAFSPASEPAGTYFLNGNMVSEINPGSLAPGNYVLKAVFRPITQLECIDSASANFNFTIIGNPAPDLGPDLELESGQEVNLNPKVAGTWRWTASIPDFSFQDNAPAVFKPGEDLILRVDAKDPTGTCSGFDEVSIKVNPLLDIPNFFTPNGDSKNQEWRIRGLVQRLKVTLYDRWGMEIYTGISDGEIAWDGSGAHKSGLYFYLLENEKTGIRYNGWVMLAQ